MSISGKSVNSSDILAFGIFLVCVVSRAVLQAFAPDSGDVSWITTFGVVGASWIGISGRVSEVLSKTEQVQKQTNGVLTAKIAEHAEAAADKAVAKAIASQQSTDQDTLRG